LKILNIHDFTVEAGMQTNARDMSIYDNKPFQCACSKQHFFQSSMDFINLPTTGVNAKMMITCPDNPDISTIVKTKYKFLVVFDRLESIAGCNGL
jgi:hypothetical protein